MPPLPVICCVVGGRLRCRVFSQARPPWAGSMSSARIPWPVARPRLSQGHWLIIVDKNDVHGRRRFTLAHEFKHIIDHPLDRLTYARLGYGNEQRRQAHIEAICQHFAACFLMPKTWVKNAYTNGVQDVYDLASLFQVSVSAMDTRLRSIGLLDEVDAEERDIGSYFRTRRDAPTLDAT